MMNMSRFSRTAAAVIAVVLAASCGRSARLDVDMTDAASSDVVVKLLDINRFKVLDTVAVDASGSFSYKIDVPKGQPEFIYLFHGEKKIASLILQGGESHAWITELGSVEQNGSFGDFVNQMLQNKCSYNDMTVSYESGKKAFNVKYSEHFMINGEIIDTNYARYENPYVDQKVERKSEIITLSFKGKNLLLNFKEGTREE